MVAFENDLKSLSIRKCTFERNCCCLFTISHTNNSIKPATPSQLTILKKLNPTPKIPDSLLTNQPKSSINFTNCTLILLSSIFKSYHKHTPSLKPPLLQNPPPAKPHSISPFLYLSSSSFFLVGCSWFLKPPMTLEVASVVRRMGSMRVGGICLRTPPRAPAKPFCSCPFFTVARNSYALCDIPWWCLVEDYIKWIWNRFKKLNK